VIIFRSAVYPVQWMTDDDMPWNGNEEDGNVGSECEEGEGSGCEDGGSDTGW